jgi:hypothetical protein
MKLQEQRMDLGVINNFFTQSSWKFAHRYSEDSTFPFYGVDIPIHRHPANGKRRGL